MTAAFDSNEFWSSWLQLRVAPVYLKRILWKSVTRWSPRELSVIDGSGLKLCEVKRGKATSACEVRCYCLVQRSLEGLPIARYRGVERTERRSFKL